MNKLRLLLLTTVLTCALHLNAAEADSASIVRCKKKLPKPPPELALIQEFFTATEQGNFKRVTELITDKKIDVHVQNEYKQTALHIVGYYAHKEIAQFLLENGANINALDIDEDTPLHELCFHNRWYRISFMLQLFLNYGADLTLTNKHKQKAFDFSLLPITEIEPEIFDLIQAAHRIDTYEESPEDKELLPDRRNHMIEKLFSTAVII